MPAPSWSVSNGIGTITSSGLYRAPQAAGTATVQAAIDGLVGTASITVSPPSFVSPPVTVPPITVGVPPTIDATATFSVVSARKHGFAAAITIADTGTTPIDDWTLQFQFAARITSIWGATVVGRGHKRYVVRNAGGDGTIDPGQSVSFGFRGRPGRVPAAPTDEVLNGIPLGPAVELPAMVVTANADDSTFPDIPAVGYDLNRSPSSHSDPSGPSARSLMECLMIGEATRDAFLQAAIDEARTGLAEGGIPIGSVLVIDGRIVGRGHNRRVQRGSAVLHAEMDAIENAGRLKAGDYRRAVLYSTLSPCDMCSGTALLYRIPRIVVGENRTFRGPEDYLRSRGVVVEVLDDPECVRLMEDFIRNNPSLWNEDIGE